MRKKPNEKEIFAVVNWWLGIEESEQIRLKKKYYVDEDNSEMISIIHKGERRERLFDETGI